MKKAPGPWATGARSFMYMVRKLFFSVQYFIVYCKNLGNRFTHLKPKKQGIHFVRDTLEKVYYYKVFAIN
jgi:hypothetical protein